ncbi:MAG: AAA family ATPase [Verrucomicrobiales bacterium]
MHECHLVCGPPAGGKTTFARVLANSLKAFLLDSDQVTERLVRAGLALAGMDPDDRDSPRYKRAYREVVYATLFDLAREHLQRGPVVIAGPFTRETGRVDGLAKLSESIGQPLEVHFVWCPPEERRRRLRERGEPRDASKLAQWDAYVATCREEAPCWAHHFVDSSKESSRR